MRRIISLIKAKGDWQRKNFLYPITKEQELGIEKLKVEGWIVVKDRETDALDNVK